MIWAYLTRTWQTLAVSALLILAALTLGYVKGYAAARDKADAERSAANVTALKIARNADEVAAVQRVGAALNIAKHKEELTDAIASTPDTAPDVARVALGCERLRAQGTPTGDIPACR